MSSEITAMNLLGGGGVAHPVGPATETGSGVDPVVRIDRWGTITNPDPMGSGSRPALEGVTSSIESGYSLCSDTKLTVKTPFVSANCCSALDRGQPELGREGAGAGPGDADLWCSLMRIGLFAPIATLNAGPAFLRTLGPAVEERGFESIWVPEHVVMFDDYDSSYPYSPDARFPAVATPACWSRSRR